VYRQNTPHRAVLLQQHGSCSYCLRRTTTKSCIMIINIAKTKELVFRRPNPRLTLDLHVITGVERVCEAKLLGVIFKDNLKIDSHVSYVLRILQSAFIFAKTAARPRPFSKQLDIVFQSNAHCICSTCLE